MGRYVRKEGYPFNTIYLREYAGVGPETGSALYYDNQQDENGNYTKNKVNRSGAGKSYSVERYYAYYIGRFYEYL